MNGEPWWVLKDICTVLEMGTNRAGEVVKRLEQDEYDSIGLTDSMGREQKTYIINESGLYSVILRSDKPQAKPFRRWVTAEVLPSIRKTGSYGTQNLSPMLQYLIQMEQKQNALESRQDELEEKLEFNQTEVIKATMAYGRIGILQRKEIRKAVCLRTIELCHFANVYESVGKRVVNSIYKALQKHFDVPSYMDITLSQYTDAIVFIKDYTPDAKLAAAISNAMPKPDFTLLNELLRAGDDVIHVDVDD